jgi:hypothetical protein
MKDVCRLDDDEAMDVVRWAATTLLSAGLEEERRSGSPVTGRDQSTGSRGRAQC